jgi:hypothetical protein
MNTLLIIIAALLPVAVLIGFHFYLERENRKADEAETARFRAMTSAERREALIKAKTDRALAREHRARVAKLYSSFKYGYRHNPYRIRYASAQGAFAGACARVEKLERLIDELDKNAD